MDRRSILPNVMSKTPIDQRRMNNERYLYIEAVGKKVMKVKNLGNIQA